MYSEGDDLYDLMHDLYQDPVPDVATIIRVVEKTNDEIDDMSARLFAKEHLASRGMELIREYLKAPDPEGPAWLLAILDKMLAEITFGPH